MIYRRTVLWPSFVLQVTIGALGVFGVVLGLVGCGRVAESVDGVAEMPSAVATVLEHERGNGEEAAEDIGEPLAVLSFEAEAVPDGHAPFGELEVNYRFAGDFGSGRPAIVLIPGWGATSWAWHKQVPSLAELGAPVLAIDLPGHGTSTEPKNIEAMTLDLFADAILAVLDDAGVEKAIAIGHSNGASAALRLYRRHPERVAALGTLDGALFPMFDLETAEQAVAPLRGTDYEDFVTQIVASMAAPGLTTAERQGLIDMAYAIPQAVLIQTVVAPADPAMYSDEPLLVPLLAIKVKQPAWSPEYEAAVRAMAPQLDYQLWEDVGHYVQLEKPEAFSAALEAFLARYSLLPG